MTRKRIELIFGALLIVVSGCSADSVEEYEGKHKTSDKKVSVWSNPILIEGSSIGEIISMAVQTENQDLLLSLTDSLTSSNHTSEEIVEMYNSAGLGFDLNLVSHTRTGKLWLLTYAVNINATRQLLVFPVIIEEDTARLQLTEFINELNKLNR